MLRRVGWIFAACAAALFVSGCGGEVGGTDIINPFFGTWSGTWSASSISESGTASLSITTSGKISGTMTNANSETGTVSGSVNGTGTMSGSVKFPGVTQRSLKGTFNPTGQNSLTAALTERVNNQDVPLTVTLTR